MSLKSEPLHPQVERTAVLLKKMVATEDADAPAELIGKPQTVNPKPQTLDPKPQTPTPKSQTPNHKPQTPNPQLQMRNRKPEP